MPCVKLARADTNQSRPALPQDAKPLFSPLDWRLYQACYSFRFTLGLKRLALPKL